MSRQSLTCRGGPMDGKPALVDEDVAFLWLLPARPGTPQRLVHNAASLLYDEIRTSTALYTRETMKQGVKRVDVLMYRPLPKTPETP